MFVVRQPVQYTGWKLFYKNDKSADDAGAGAGGVSEADVHTISVGSGAAGQGAGKLTRRKRAGTMTSFGPALRRLFLLPRCPAAPLPRCPAAPPTSHPPSPTLS